MQGCRHGLVTNAVTGMTPPSEGPHTAGLMLYGHYVEIRDNCIFIIATMGTKNGELGAMAPMQACLPPTPCSWGLMLSPLAPQSHSAFPPQPPRSNYCQPAPNLGSGMGRVKDWTGAAHGILGWGMAAASPALCWQHQGTFSGGRACNPPRFRHRVYLMHPGTKVALPLGLPIC